MHDTDIVIGSIDLRLLTDSYQYYYGHVGYNIFREYRGHHYALDACKILVDIAGKEYHMNELIFTCNPDNKASYHTLVNLGCQLIEKVKVPISHELYWRGEREKCIFKYRCT